MKLREECDDVGPIVLPAGTWVAQQVKLLELAVALQAGQGQQPCLGNEVHGQIQLPQRLAALQVLDLGQVVDRYVQVLKLLQVSIPGITKKYRIWCVTGKFAAAFVSS